MTRPAAGIVGPGRVGLSLAAALRSTDRFRRVWVAGRGPDRPEFLEARPEIGYAASGRWRTRLAGGGHPPLVLFFAVPDDALRSAVSAWAAALEGSSAPRLRAAFHTSGARPAADLAALRSEGDGGGAVPEARGPAPESGRTPVLGSLHPLAALSEPRADAFRGVHFGVEGDPEAVRYGAELVEEMGGRPLRVRSGEKARYHAAAVFASNLVAACLGEARREMGRALESDPGDGPLLGLAATALRALEREGFPGGVTGPVARGDLETVAAHLEALDPSTRDLYARMTRTLADHAGLDAEAREKLLRVLDGATTAAAGVTTAAEDDAEAGDEGARAGAGPAGPADGGARAVDDSQPTRTGRCGST